jgi:hypothetical protein
LQECGVPIHPVANEKLHPCDWQRTFACEAFKPCVRFAQNVCVPIHCPVGTLALGLKNCAVFAPPNTNNITKMAAITKNSFEVLLSFLVAIKV